MKSNLTYWLKFNFSPTKIPYSKNKSKSSNPNLNLSPFSPLRLTLKKKSTFNNKSTPFFQVLSQIQSKTHKLHKIQSVFINQANSINTLIFSLIKSKIMKLSLIQSSKLSYKNQAISTTLKKVVSERINVNNSQKCLT